MGHLQPRAATEVDLSTCDRERIEVPQAIQPHGIYLGVSRDEFRLTAVSGNCEAFVGRPPEALLGAHLRDVVGETLAAQLDPMLHSASARPQQALPLVLPRATKQAHLEATVHLYAERLAIELEPAAPERMRPLALHGFVRHAMAQLRNTADLAALCRTSAALVRQVTGFDRVVVYRFDESNNGIVIAEDRVDSVTALLGLHFPASDIPAQARQMYINNSLRAIPDVHYVPVPIVATKQDARRGPIDLTQAILRSVSPVHREYMANMGLTASMSVSLIHEGRLWGLISCSHESGPHRLPFSVRATCETLADMTALLIDSKERNNDSAYKLRLKDQQSRLLHRVNQSTNFTEAFTQGSPSLLDVTNATGAAVYYNDTLTLAGKTPSQAQVLQLLTWLRETHPMPLFVSQSLAAVYPPAKDFKASACGLVAAAMTRGRNSYVLWFREEVLQTIHWGGDPAHSKEVEPSTMRIHPRRSFAAYKQLVHSTSLPWKEAELEAASEMIRSISDIVLDKAEALQRLNTDLRRSNHELDAFAYAASHDLKEPLRGISNYTELALEELNAEQLQGDGARRLRTVVKLTRRMEDLIDSLLHYSHLGRTQLTMADVDLNEVVRHVQEMTSQRLQETATQLCVAPKMPTVRGDPVLLGELFANLITNAIKYNDKAERWVCVGYEKARKHAPTLMFVRDNGIGIEERNVEAVFKIFRRLHAREAFGGGTGTGLTIARQIVQRHGGRIYVDSQLGRGTTFYFTLAGAGANA